MGSGASTSPVGSPEPHSKQNGDKPTATTKPLDPDEKGALVRTNQVAPIIIKNCKEEFQHVSEFNEPIVYGRIADNMPEHALIKNKYFLVSDMAGDHDELETFSQYLAANMRRCTGGYPVYAMGQPTNDGLVNFMQNLKDDGYLDIILVNLRDEPVLFIKDQFDHLPYSVRHQDSINECITHQADGDVDHINDFECELRKEVIDLAALKETNDFYFYNDLDDFQNEPHMYLTGYEDDLAVSEEVYSRLAFNNNGIRYLRLCLPKEGAPLESDIDQFVSLFRTLPEYFEKPSTRIPAMLFTSHLGRSRATLGTVLGCLMLAQKTGFPKGASKSPYPINEKSPNFDRGEFHAIQLLVKYLPKGLQIKQEVDVIIDNCAKLLNLRSLIAETKKTLEAIEEDYEIQGKSAREYFRERCAKHLERYFYLICFNAYVRSEHSTMFSKTFSRWMNERSELYVLLRYIDVSERFSSSDLLSKGLRFLTADDYLGLDVLSSQMDVKCSNFRRVPGLPVYGVAQPSREGLACLVKHLLSKKQGHPLVVLFNLRDDLVVECNGATYSIRESNALESPITMPGISTQEIEEKEELLKNEIKENVTFQVYQESDQKPESRDFNSVLTCVDMSDQLKMQTKEFQYHRLPMQDDLAPPEKIFDQILSVMKKIEEMHTDEDGPALVFQCRTGKGRSTTAMAIAGLFVCHNKGFPYGTKPGEEERVSLPNAKYTQGHYKIVSEVVRKIPNGQQMKREVDFMLNQCSDTMTPMHYHVREVIFVTYNKSKKAKTEGERNFYRKRSLQYLERYIYLILFNTYLHCERRSKWDNSFSKWMSEVAAKAGMYDVLDSLAFFDFESVPDHLRSRRARCTLYEKKEVFRGQFV